MNPDVKCLAVAVEDHPLDYARFEGAIPAGVRRPRAAAQVEVHARGEPEEAPVAHGRGPKRRVEVGGEGE